MRQATEGVTCEPIETTGRDGSRMATCHDIELLVASYVDDEATAAERTRVRAHLETCPTCRRLVEAGAAARAAVRAHKTALVSRAPASLRARCAETLRLPAVRPVQMPRLARLAMAAAALLAVVGVSGYVLLTRSATAFAAELTLDHVKCFSLYEAAAGPPDPVQMATQLREQYGVDLAIPPSSVEAGIELIAVRRCLIADGHLAHLLYRHQGRALSLFVLPSVERSAGRTALFGFRTRVWVAGGMTFAVVAKEPEEELDRAAAYFQHAMGQQALGRVVSESEKWSTIEARAVSERGE